MKKFTYNFICTVLVLALCLCLPLCAYAEDKKGEEKEPVFSLSIYVPKDGSGWEEVTDMAALFGTDHGFRVRFGKAAEAKSLRDIPLRTLIEGGMTLTPPKGYAIAGLYLTGEGKAVPEGAKSLTLLARPEAGSPVLTLEKELFSEKFDTEKWGSPLLPKDEKRCTLRVELRPLDEETPITIRYLAEDRLSLSAPLVEGGDSFSLTTEVPQESGETLRQTVPHTVLPLPEETEKACIQAHSLRFTGWRLRYENGAEMLLSPGDQLLPYEPCELTAAFEEVLVVTLGDASKTYDGSPLLPDVSALTCQGLPEGYTCLTDAGAVTGSVTEAGEGESGLDLTKFHVLDAEGLSADGEYQGRIVVFPGRLTVSKRALTVTVGSREALYSGADLLADTFTADGLPEEHRVELSFTGSCLLPGSTAQSSAENIRVLLGEQDVTDSFSVQLLPGSLHVLPREGDSRIPLTVKPKDVTAPYSGEAVHPSEYALVAGTLPAGDTLTITYAGSQTEPGCSASSVAEIHVLHGEADVSGNYLLSTEEGTLTVQPRPLTLVADSAEKTEDGLPLTKPDCHILSGTLLEGHTLSSVTVEGSQTTVGSSANVIRPGSVVIGDQAGEDVTAYYSLTLDPGTLTVKQPPVIAVTLGVGDLKKIYDGTPLSVSSADVRVLSGSALPAGYSLIASFNPQAITSVGKTQVTITAVHILDEAGKDITSRYDITRETGTMEITPRPLTIQTKSATKAYDGKALTNKSVPVVTGKAENHQVSLQITGKQTKVGTSDNTVSHVIITDKATGADVTANYDIRYLCGKLIVTAAEKSADDDASPLTADTAPQVGMLIGIMVMSLVVVAELVLIIVRGNKKNKKK